MQVLPAIDIKDGKCVRLIQGDMEQATVFGDRPVQMARRWVDEGAEILHLVDLNGAFARTPVNLDAVREIAEQVDLPLELGGGIRDLATIEMILDLGVQYAILGTVAAQNPGLVREACRAFPGRIRVGIDARGGKVAINGWAEVTDMPATELARQFSDMGVDAIIYTDIGRDGMLGGINVEETRNLARSLDIPVIASGGLSTLDDIRALRACEPDGISGVIAGKAIYTGAIDLRAAIALAETADD